MKHALEKGRDHGILVNPHCEESELYRQWLTKQNGNQIMIFDNPPYTSENGFISRDIQLAEKAGAHIHISHVSLAESVKTIADAKKRGVKVTAEATPHHFVLTEEMAKEIEIETNAKVNPPLRTEEDVEAVKQGLADGTIDVIASDHAPHSPEEKSREWDEAPFGVIGLETTLGLVLTYLVRPGILTMMQAIEKMTIAPARIFGLDELGIGSLAPQTEGDVTIIDPDRRWKVDPDSFQSKGRNCPFSGWEMQGRAVITMVNGQIVAREGRIISGGE